MLIYYYTKWVIKYCVCDLEVCCRLFVCSWYLLQSFDYVWIVFLCDGFFDSLSLLDYRWFVNDCRFVVFQFLSLYLVMLTFGCFSYVLRAAIWLFFSLSWRIYFYFWVISFYDDSYLFLLSIFISSRWLSSIAACCVFSSIFI